MKSLRESKGMTQTELGEILGIQKAAVQKIESGLNDNLRADKIILICKTFRIFPEHLLYGDDYIGIVLEYDEDYNLLDESKKLALGSLVLNDVVGQKGLELYQSDKHLNQNGLERLKLYADDLIKITEYIRSN